MGTKAQFRFYQDGEPEVCIYTPMDGGLENIHTKGFALLSFLAGMTVSEDLDAVAMHSGFGEMALDASDLAAQVLVMLKSPDQAGDIYLDPHDKRLDVLDYKYHIYTNSRRRLKPPQPEQNPEPFVVIHKWERDIKQFVEIHRGRAGEVLREIFGMIKEDPVSELVENVRCRLAFLSGFMGSLGVQAHASEMSEDVVDLCVNGVPLVQIEEGVGDWAVHELIYVAQSNDAPPDVYTCTRAQPSSLSSALIIAIGVIARLGMDDYHIADMERFESAASQEIIQSRS